MARTQRTAVNKARASYSQLMECARTAAYLLERMPADLNDSQKCAELQRRVGELRQSTSDQLRVRLLALVSVALDWAAKIEGAE